MSSTPYLAVVKAEYEYAATNEEELSIAEEQLLYVLEDDDQDWWKVRVKQSPSSGASPADAPTGLVPAGYVVPVPPIKQVVAQYEYTATSEEEISIAEGETYDLYEDDGEWSLVGARGGKKEVGFAPTAYLEEDGNGAAGVASLPHEEASEAAAAPMAAQATSSSIGRANGQGDKVKTWSGITEMDGKKKKKGTLGVGNGAIFFASDSDKAPVQKKSLGDLNDLKTEKQKHIILTFSDEELHFTVSSKDEHAEIVAKIEASRDFANSGGGDADEESAAPAASNSNGGFVPPPPPPPPPPPAVGGGFGHLPPPPRRMFNPSDDEDSDDNDDEPAPARAAPPTAAFVPPPPPPPPAPPAVMSPPVRAPAAAAAAPRAPPRQDGKKAVAEYEFTAAGTEELSISEGETLWVLDDSADDWWKVRNERGEEGEVPASYITIEDGAAGAGQADTGDDEAAARRLQDEHKAEARKEKERLRLKALEEEARGLSSFSNVNLPPPPRRTAAASPGTGSGTATPTRVTSPSVVAASSAVVPPPPPPPPPSSGGEPPRREDSGRDREADREERRRRHREERDRQRREEELLRNRGSTSMPGGGGHSAPVEKSKPNASRVRTWKDKTGAFKVDAEFIGLSGANGEKIRLHKLNGVVIEVPVDKMSADDIRVIEHVTRRRLNRDRQGSGDDRRSSQAGGDRERERDRRDDRRDRDRDDRRGGDDSGHRARPPSATAAGKRVSMAASQTKKSTMDWFDFFLSAGCDVDDCSRYANNFEKDRIDESILPDLEAGTLRSLGLREGDIIRVSKHIKSKMGSSAAQGGAMASSDSGEQRSSAQRAPSPPEKLSKEEQLMEDEELARKMQEELNAGRDGSGLFTNASGGIKNTRRGRPNANRAAPSSASMDAITSSLTGDRTKTPDIDRRVSPDTSRDSRARASSTAQSSSGFDDDAWTVKPATPAPAPAKPATPSLVDLSPAPSAPTPPPAPSVNRDLASPAPAMPGNSREPSNAQALTDAYLETMGLGKRQVSSPAPMVNRQTASPAPAQQQQQIAPQQTGYYAPSPVNNGPRAPVAPIPLNQQLLNPLIPTQTGLTGYVPTRNQPSPMMMPQATGWQQQQQQQPQMQMQQPQPQMLAPMQTGFQGGMGMMQPQQTGYPINQMQQMSIQPTGSPFNQPAMSASPSMYSQPQQQQMSQAPMQQPQPTSSNSSSSSAADYQPSSIFAQMKTGQFAKPADAPQAEQKYDSLRPQPTGFVGGGFGQPQFPQQTGFGGMGMGMGMQQTGFGGMGQQQQQPQQQQMQPLQAQPTGFAPGGYVGMPPQQTGMMYGQPQQQQGYPYRQF